MHPRLLTTPFFTVYTFGLLLASAYVAAFWWLMREGRRDELDVDALASLGFWTIGGAIIGYPSICRMPRDLAEPWRSFLADLDDLVSHDVRLHCCGGFVVTML